MTLERLGEDETEGHGCTTKSAREWKAAWGKKRKLKCVFQFAIYMLPGHLGVYIMGTSEHVLWLGASVFESHEGHARQSMRHLIFWGMMYGRSKRQLPAMVA